MFYVYHMGDFVFSCFFTGERIVYWKISLSARNMRGKL